MTDFRACFGPYDDDLPFPSFEDCGGGIDEEDNNDVEFQSAEVVRHLYRSK